MNRLFLTMAIPYFLSIGVGCSLEASIRSLSTKDNPKSTTQQAKSIAAFSIVSVNDQITGDMYQTRFSSGSLVNQNYEVTSGGYKVELTAQRLVISD